MVTAIMKPWKKIVIGIGALLLVVAIVGFTVHQSSKNVVTVQTGKAQHLDLATVVSASGEIKPAPMPTERSPIFTSRRAIM